MSFVRHNGRFLSVFTFLLACLIMAQPSSAWAAKHLAAKKHSPVAKASKHAVAKRVASASHTRTLSHRSPRQKQPHIASRIVERSFSKAQLKKMTPAQRRAALHRVNYVKPEPIVVAPPAEFDANGFPLLHSASFLVQDVETGRVLLEKNIHLSQPIASITKLMTAMVVLDANLDLNELLTVDDSDVDRLKGTSSHIPLGTSLSRGEWLRLALMSSENRAASLLGRAYPGGLPAFLDAMNIKAQSLGLLETRFYDSIGLNKNNVSSARDLAALTRAAARYPLIREYTTTPEYKVNMGSRERMFHNTNGLVREGGWQIQLSKTGYISESGKCLVMQATLANRPTTIVLLDSNGRYTRVADAIRIRKWVEGPSAAQAVSAALPAKRVRG